MPTYAQFCVRTKMRYDFADQFQVRYQHSDGEAYDTWVSGEEALRRLASASQESRLRALRELDWRQIREAQAQWSEQGKQRLQDEIQDQLGEQIDALIGGNEIGDSLAAAVKGEEQSLDPDGEEQRRWQRHMSEDLFYAQVLELAWIQLRGSLPEDSLPEDSRPDDDMRRVADDWL